MSIERADWGEAEGRPVEIYTLTSGPGMAARIATYGATVVNLWVPDRAGVFGDVVLGYDTLDDYVRNPRYFGATVGRVGNRIAGAQFELDGVTYRLDANDGPNHLHGGSIGWDKVVWDAAPAETADGPSLRLTYLSPDGDAGYPGAVQATTTYTLTHGGELAIEMTTTADRLTIVNMVHHSYFNLGADGVRDVCDHVLQLFADAWTPGMPPDGRVEPIAGTPFDFRKPKSIGRDTEAAGSPGGSAPPGYDSNWVVNGDPTAVRPVARVYDPTSGRVMTLSANQPGVQFYSGTFLDGSTSGKGRRHTLHAGLCLETQAFPNAINVPAWRDQVLLEPGRTYRHVSIYGFGAE